LNQKNGNLGTQSKYGMMRNIQDQLNDFMKRSPIIVVDCGRNETKVRYPSGQPYAFPSRVVEAAAGDTAVSYGGDDGQRKTVNLTMGYRGKYWHIGTRAQHAAGDLRTNFDSKISRDSVLLTLASLWLAGLEGNQEIRLVFGLPMNFDPRSYRKTCKNLTKLLQGKHTVEVAGEKHIFTIKEVIFPYECASGYFDLIRYEQDRMSGKNLLFVDVGAATKQAAFYAWGEGVHTLIPEQSFCLDGGYDHEKGDSLKQVCQTIYQRVNQQNKNMLREDLVIIPMGRAYKSLEAPLKELFGKGGNNVEVILPKHGTYTNVEGMYVRGKNQIYREKKQQLEQSAGVAQ